MESGNIYRIPKFRPNLSRNCFRFLPIDNISANFESAKGWTIINAGEPIVCIENTIQHFPNIESAFQSSNILVEIFRPDELPELYDSISYVSPNISGYVMSSLDFRKFFVSKADFQNLIKIS